MNMYYFPIDKIEKDSNIAVYGYGLIGKALIEWNERYKWCNIQFIIDRDANKKHAHIPIYAIDTLPDAELDYILLASKEHENDFLQEINRLGISLHKVILLEDRIKVETFSPASTASQKGEENYWGKWYGNAEKNAEEQFSEILLPRLEKYNLIKKDSSVLDFGCGEGRITNILQNYADNIYCCDISKPAIAKCVERFADNSRIHCFKNYESYIPLENKSIDVIITLGTMVHFDLEEVKKTFKEFSRILKDNGYCIMHHSNWRHCAAYCKTMDGHSNDGYFRGDVSLADIKYLAVQEKIEVLEYELMPWGKAQYDIDCITILKKAGR